MRGKILFFLLLCTLSFAQTAIVNTNPIDIKRYINTKIETEKVVKLLDNLYVAEFPKFRPLKAIADIHLHPDFTKVILFKGYKIKKAFSSFKPVFFSIYKNALYIRVSPNFVAGSINLILENPRGEEVFVQLIAEGTNPYKDYPPYNGIQRVGKVKVKPVLFYPLEIFVDRPILSPEEVLDKYLALYKTLPKEDTYFFIDGVGYKIYTHPKVPNVRIDDRNFRVEVEKISS